MLSFLWSLPKTSWKARVLALLFTALGLSVVWQQWPHRDDDLAIARWMAWSLLISVSLQLPSLLVVCLLGRLPKVWQGLPGRLGRTLPQIRAEIAQEQQDRRDRSRLL